MNPLTANESRVLGVLIEKAATTPEQYPLSLNAATSGANQKNNRDPVLSLSDDEVFDALESLRGKGLAIRVDVPGNRVAKYRHNAADALHARPGELAILGELMLRGPQTLGELRGRASRMAPIESLEAARGLLEALMARDEPLVRQLPPLHGTRAERYVQLLWPDVRGTESPREIPAESEASENLADRVARLESQVSELSSAVERLTARVENTPSAQ